MSGTADNGSIYPGDTGLLLGHKAIPGFFGSGGSGAPNLGQNGPGTLASSASSRSIAIAARPGDHPSTQRQLIWRIQMAVGTPGLNLQVSVDGSDWITIDTSSANGVRVIGAERGAATAIPDAQATAKILSSARFIRVTDTGSGTTAYVDVTCQ